jgi:antitoxin Phd
MATMTVGLSEAKANLGRITSEVNRTGEPITVFKNNKPWVVIYPATVPETISNQETLAAMDEADRMFQEGVRYDNFVDMMAALKKAVDDV